MYISRFNFKPISRQQHIEESVMQLISTPRGSRVFRPKLGTLLYQSVDAVLNPRLKLQLISEVMDVIGRYEPRVRVTRVTPWLDQGHLHIQVACQTLEGEPIQLAARLN